MTDNQQANLPDWARSSHAIGPAQYGTGYGNFNQGHVGGGYSQEQGNRNFGQHGPSYTDYNTYRPGTGPR